MRFTTKNLADRDAPGELGRADRPTKRDHLSSGGEHVSQNTRTNTA
jgi:hypothetical protein